MCLMILTCARLTIGYLEPFLIRKLAVAGESNAYRPMPVITLYLHVVRVYVRPTEAHEVGRVPQLDRSVVRNLLK